MTDPFSKCRLPEAEALAASGLYPYYLPVEERPGGGEVVVGGRRVLMAGSNDYLALADDPRLKEAGAEALRRAGRGQLGVAGCSTARSPCTRRWSGSWPRSSGTRRRWWSPPATRPTSR
ncbi:hypothetical protein GCM10020220_076340 [Nonomuraea rubra]|uniref:hypothetical protein n=1 Tax=Nonomuraea rubra TaxID=46180 RepID=UPI0031E51B6D